MLQTSNDDRPHMTREQGRWGWFVIRLFPDRLWRPGFTLRRRPLCRIRNMDGFSLLSGFRFLHKRGTAAFRPEIGGLDQTAESEYGLRARVADAEHKGRAAWRQEVRQVFSQARHHEA